MLEKLFTVMEQNLVEAGGDSSSTVAVAVTAVMAAVEEAVAAAVAAAERGHLRSPSGGYRFFIEALSNMGLALY